jgi:tryptophanase
VHESVKFFIDKFRELLDKDTEPGKYYVPRPYKNAAVSLRGPGCSIQDFEARYAIAEQTGFNVFMFPSNMIPGCDLLSDSGTSTMTIKQWAAMLQGDEAYGSNEGYQELKDQIRDTFGPDYEQQGAQREVLFLFHQGRAAEHALFTTLRHELADRGEKLGPLAQSKWLEDMPEGIRKSITDATGSIERRITRRRTAHRDIKFVIPSNGHFDTTQENIEDRHVVPLNLPCEAHIAKDESNMFRGDMDVDALEELLARAGDHVPLVYLTITNNTGGGQPVSMANIKAVGKVAHKYDVPFMLDACRFAENAWYIWRREPGYQKKSIMEIVREMFAHADGFHISLKKDGLVNMGGGLVVKSGGLLQRKYPGLRDRLIDWQIMVEGHPTYGGLAGRDLKGIAEGLRTVVRREYLDHRIGQVEAFGGKLDGYGIPVVKPIGGHAVYIDVDEFFDGDKVRDEDFKGLAFTALLLIAGHRLCELGVFAFGRYDPAAGTEIPPSPRVNYVRAAVPRLAYEDQDLFSVAEAVRILHEHRDRLPGMLIKYGQDLTLRHFKSKFGFA